MDVHLFEERRPTIGTMAILGSAMKPINQVWELVVWDPNVKKYVPDNGPTATLRLTGYTDHIDECPPRYRGRIPTPETIAYCAKLQRAHEEWVERREVMMFDHD